MYSVFRNKTTTREEVMAWEGLVPAWNRGRDEINLLDHCLFCLRRLTSVKSGPNGCFEGGSDDEDINGDTQGVVPRANIKELTSINSFDHIWPYLQERWRTQVFPKFVSESLVGSSVFRDVTEVPPMCHSCGDKIEQLNNLHKELIVKVEEIQRIISDSSKGGRNAWRLQLFENSLRSSHLKQGSISTTLRFLERLRQQNSEVEEEEEAGE